MTDDDIRRALTRYADATPHLDPRDGLAARVTRRDRARRATVAGTAASLLLVGGAGVAALTRDDDRAGIGPAAPSTSPAPAVYTAAGDDGLRVRVTVAPAGPGAADAVQVRVEASDDDGPMVVSGIDWGDGSVEPIERVMPACFEVADPAATGSPAPRAKEPGALDKTYTHAWRHAGTYAVAVSVETGDGCSPAPPEEAVAAFEVPVGPGAQRSNGPAPVAGDAAHVRPYQGAEPYERVVTSRVTDPDGYVTRVVVEWGDGSAPATFTSDATCDDGDGRHFPVTEPFRAGYDLRAEHTFPRAGEFVVTLTYTSAGCDGRDEQTATERLPVLATAY